MQGGTSGGWSVPVGGTEEGRGPGFVRGRHACESTRLQVQTLLIRATTNSQAGGGSPTKLSTPLSTNTSFEQCYELTEYYTLT